MDQKPKKPSKFTALRTWINHHRLVTLIVSGALAIAVVGNVALALMNAPLPAVIPDIFVKPKPKVYYSPLTGLKVKNKAATAKPVTAIMLENSPDARPQSGLKQAEVVYEAIAEGGITRFLALYQQNKPGLIGPVRSVRPYYVDWVTPYNASVAHVGGNAPALRQLRNGNYRDIDQFFNASTYWRVSDRYAPHNVYTDFKHLDALNKSKGYKISHPKPFARTDTKPAAKPTAARISVHISGPLFDSSYRYDKKHDYYLRFQAGAPHKDREMGTIHPKVIIVLNVKERTVVQDTARQQITTTGTGKVTIFQNGKVIKGTWHRKNRYVQYTFKNTDGKEIELARGQTWITAIPNGEGSVSWRK